MDNNRVYKLAIRCEEFNKWERRSVLTPQNCKSLLFQLKGRLAIKVQPSNSRIFTNDKYAEAGCEITNDISDCDLILGVKQVPIDQLFPDKTYMFFSHTIKAQEQNMAMLDDILQKNIRLIDYERIANENNQRLVAFGIFAGNAGAIDIFSGLGTFLLSKGIGTPFLNISQSYHYMNIEHAKSSIRTVASAIENEGICSVVSPFIVGVTGNGRCAQGALDILQLFPHEFIEPEQLESLSAEAKLAPEKFNKLIYIVQFRHEHLAKRDDNTHTRFSKSDYYKNPEEYVDIFQKVYLPYISVLVNCIYWDDRFPRLITGEYLKEYTSSGKELRLLAISDVTCDYIGSIDFLTKFTTIDHPFFVYNPENGNMEDDFRSAKSGILYLSVENLPSQFPLDASKLFGQQLTRFIAPILLSDKKLSLTEQNLPEEISKAVVTNNGKLTNLFTYITKLRNEREKFVKKGLKEVEEFRGIKAKGKHIHLYLEGHLFDQFIINDVFNLLVDQHHFDCSILKWNVGFGEQNPSSCIIQLVDDGRFFQVFEEIKQLFVGKDAIYKVTISNYLKLF